jgi:hypothetical protein
MLIRLITWCRTWSTRCVLGESNWPVPTNLLPFERFPGRSGRLEKRVGLPVASCYFFVSVLGFLATGSFAAL